MELIDVTEPKTDGLLLRDHTLYAADHSDFLSGVVTRVMTNPAMNTGTSVARFGDSLYAVNGLQGALPFAKPPVVVRLPLDNGQEP